MFLLYGLSYVLPGSSRYIKEALFLLESQDIDTKMHEAVLNQGTTPIPIGLYMVTIQLPCFFELIGW